MPHRLPWPKQFGSTAGSVAKNGLRGAAADPDPAIHTRSALIKLPAEVAEERSNVQEADEVSLH